MKTIAVAVFFILSAGCFAQQAMRFEEAKEKGIYPAIEDNYKSAVHSDMELAVFKSDEDVRRHTEAYQSFLQGLGRFLLDNNFKWEETARCFNRIYMAPDGTIRYFLYQFRTPLAAEKEKEFGRLLNLYITQNKFGVSAPENFHQCSPVVYPKTEG